jgi:hypothetical protein
MKLTPNGTFLFYANDYDKVFKIQAATGTIITAYQFQTMEYLYTIDISSNGIKLAVGGGPSNDGYFCILDLINNSAIEL